MHLDAWRQASYEADGYAEAELLSQRGLAIREKVLGLTGLTVYHAGDYGAPRRFGMGNQTQADLKKYAQ
jgi:hypothetical protein